MPTDDEIVVFDKAKWHYEGNWLKRLSEPAFRAIWDNRLDAGVDHV